MAESGERSGRKAQQRVVELSLGVLTRAAYKSRTDAIDTLEVKLALAALWCVLRDRSALRHYWDRAQRPAENAWDTAHNHARRVAHACRDEGWDVHLD